MEEVQQHFVLVHGACHGAWCWFKLKPLLESAGHRVTAMDLSASGINPKKIEEVETFEDYSLPLLEFMASIPPDEKIILVGHSLGGMNIALASERFPEKVLVAVFLTAFMPDSVHAPSYPLDQYLERMPAVAFMDNVYKSGGSPEEPRTTTIFVGPQFLATKLYHLTAPQDLELAKFLVRPGSFFVEDLSRAEPLSEERYGSVKRAYIRCGEDKTVPEFIQSFLIETVGVSVVKEMEDSGHMPMLSMTEQLCQMLREIADEFTTS